MTTEAARFLLWGPSGDRKKDDMVAKYIASTQQQKRIPMHQPQKNQGEPRGQEEQQHLNVSLI
jgi:hypothetical protein